MIEFNQKEIDFLESLEEARIATSHKNIPHVKPVSFIFHENNILVATDYNTRTFSNIKDNPKIGIVIDIYQSGNHKAICIQGKVEIVENGSEFKKYYDIFHKKFEWVREDPWDENEAPFLKIIPNNKVSWGLK
ncbi:pyridoxamine 5'-phosphate oxidase family protein [Nitrosopumilus adriaticus]|uniref:Pyridoxamine 5'-phosphate oxidase-like FMN-binding protein n=1 Tax=Nitrosopumilus adriaticus TaxID=1580092 RepID=A0A0D5C1W1_9ARCH|nr:pyridoxamine 5'-phosphate oxidase family protein [Nitrosopumilus adriaticus]AJW70731.1 Pyridoxamine 5'-phosphate oxidase-like FMN-binding protein [Nitrosopumilus adriaticus]